VKIDAQKFISIQLVALR